MREKETYKFDESHYIDDLTGLLNSKSLLITTKDYVDNWIATEDPFIMLHLLVPDQEELSETFSDTLYESLVKQMSERILEKVKLSAACARVDQMHFVISSKCATKEEAEEFSRKLKQILEAPYEVEDQTVTLTIETKYAFIHTTKEAEAFLHS